MDDLVLSTFEKLMQKLQEEGKVKMMDEDESFTMQKEIHQEMEAYSIMKQRKVAESEKDLATIVLTA